MQLTNNNQTNAIGYGNEFRFMADKLLNQCTLPDQILRLNGMQSSPLGVLSTLSVATGVNKEDMQTPLINTRIFEEGRNGEGTYRTEAFSDGILKSNNVLSPILNSTTHRDGKILAMFCKHSKEDYDRYIRDIKNNLKHNELFMRQLEINANDCGNLSDENREQFIHFTRDTITPLIEVMKHTMSKHMNSLMNSMYQTILGKIDANITSSFSGVVMTQGGHSINVGKQGAPVSLDSTNIVNYFMNLAHMYATSKTRINNTTGGVRVHTSYDVLKLMDSCTNVATFNAQRDLPNGYNITSNLGVVGEIGLDVGTRNITITDGLGKALLVINGCNNVKPSINNEIPMYIVPDGASITKMEISPLVDIEETTNGDQMVWQGHYINTANALLYPDLIGKGVVTLTTNPYII